MDFPGNKLFLKPRRRELRKNQTDAERLLWSRLRRKQFFGLKFYRQYSIGPYILDFYCHEKQLGIELDGGQHNQPSQKGYDQIRNDYLNHHGIRIIRFWNNDVLKNLEGVWQRLTEELLPTSSLKEEENSRGSGTPLPKRG